MAPRLLLSLMFLLISVSAQAQLYKWVDADGKVTYSDMPPPKSAVKVETKSLSSSDSTVALPFELATAAKNSPVTIYSSTACTPCDDGRSFLKQNGIPFSEKTVATNADIEKFKKLSGGSNLPFLMIGKVKLLGFNSSEWRNSLSQAGYPESNMLPGEYQYPAPEPAAPVVTENKNDASQPPAQPAAPARDPNGFQF